jgi:hypothetical protein
MLIEQSTSQRSGCEIRFERGRSAFASAVFKEKVKGRIDLVHDAEVRGRGALGERAIHRCGMS